MLRDLSRVSNRPRLSPTPESTLTFLTSSGALRRSASKVCARRTRQPVSVEVGKTFDVLRSGSGVSDK